MHVIGPAVTIATGLTVANYAGKFGDRKVDIKEGEYAIPKYDMYFDNVKYMNTELWFMPDLCLVILYGMTFLLHVVGLFNVDYVRFGYELGTLYIIRGIACRLTVGYVSPRSLATSDIKGGANCYITDLVISGHTMTASVLFCNVLDVCTSNWLVMLYTIVWAVSVSSNLFVGDHYSSDVFIGLVLTWLLHY